MAAAGSNDQDGARGKPARILLVDDEQPVQKLLSFPAREGGLRGRARARRAGGAEALRKRAVRPRRARHHAAEDRRSRGVPADAREELGADHHADREGRGDRQGARPRDRRRRLHHEAVLDARVPQPRAGRAAPCRDEPARRRRRAARPRRPPHRPGEAHHRAERRAGAAHVRRVRDPLGAGAASRAASTRATCCWTGSGATPRFGTSEPSTCTSATCARSSSRIRGSPSTC